jgi:ABC-type spermidine/putrescine transport system permease subunit II
MVNSLTIAFLATIVSSCDWRIGGGYAWWFRLPFIMLVEGTMSLPITCRRFAWRCIPHLFAKIDWLADRPARVKPSAITPLISPSLLPFVAMVVRARLASFK